MNWPAPPAARTTGGELAAAAKIVGLCVAAAVSYGVLHDQVTARVCVEYFTVAHPLLVPTTDPTVLGLVWGVVATWWVGAGLGLMLAVAARLGGRTPRGWRDLLRPVAVLLLVCGVLAAAAEVCGYAFGGGPGALFPPAREWSAEKQSRFLGVLIAHNVSYLAGGLGGLILCGLTFFRRPAATTGGSASAAG